MDKGWLRTHRHRSDMHGSLKCQGSSLTCFLYVLGCRGDEGADKARTEH